LISQHNEKFSLLTVSGVFHYPGRHLLRNRRRTGDRRSLLFGDARRSDSAYRSGGGCNKKQRTKNTAQS
jgi:hypothetical protein